MNREHSIIIGATRGIGRALVRLLSGDGHVIDAVGKNPPAPADQDLPGVTHRIADVCDPGGLSRSLDRITDEHGAVNNLVFLQRYRGQDGQWDAELATTLTATKNAIEKLKTGFAAGGGSIVVASSMIGRFVASGQPVGYHVAKSALEALARFYAVELGGRNIRVNSVSPFTILKEESRAFYLNHHELMALYKKIVPLGRLGTSEDVAGVIRFLCRPEASFISGQNIIVDGGLSLKWQESLARELMLP